MPNDPLWIEHAHMKKGAFTAKAKKAGMSVAGFAKKKASAGGTLGREARAAQTLRGLSAKKAAS